MYSYILKDCRIVDGTGKPEYRGDVGLRGDAIATIGALERDSGERVLECSGLVLAPGFVDIHSHSDLGALDNPQEENKLSQGVTTEIAGNCGFSLFPVTEGGKPAVRAMMKTYGKDVDLPWSSGAEYYRLLERAGIGFNYYPLVGHGMLRINAMGFDARPAGAGDLALMADLLEAEMQGGARGFSSGLGYMPGCFADTAELVALGRVAARRGGVYTSHIRDQGRGLLASIEEAVRVGEEAGLPVVVSHLKAYGISNWGMAGRALEILDKARARGLAVMADFYPYESSSTTLMYELPEWAKAGGPAAIFGRLSDPADRERIKGEILAKGELSWDRVTVCGVRTEANRGVVGKSIADIAGERGTDPGDAALDLLVEESGNVETVCSVMSADDVDEIALSQFTALGSDAYALDASAPFAGHPRNFGAFPRFIARYVREKRLLSLEEAVRKTSALAAEFLGLADRGRIAEGLKADLVLFDPDAVDSRADYLNPSRRAEGIEAVFVNGSLAYGRDGGGKPAASGSRSGRVLARR
ncbi:MAG: D-aminoacylase [Spirochaetes bacterium]|nr:D-aminoacylase [Spirochaetota bacterium]MBU1081963.1 D-aminoacylase [Spirochaetota bacterium]